MYYDFEQLLTNKRRYDLDWLRVIAFGILIYFHAAVAFLPEGLPLTINAEPSKVLSVMVSFLHQFRLALLFFVSGCGVFFALKKRDRKSFFAERTKRLVIPLLFGIVALVPFMVYLEKRYLGNSYSSFFGFYSEYFTNGVYPVGNLSWHHFWFLAYLYLFCLLAWPIFKWLKSEYNKLKLEELDVRYKLNSTGIYLFIIPLLIVELLLRPIFPGFRDLIHDWASFSHWFMIFLTGYLFAYDRRFLISAQSKRRGSLIAACLTTTVLFNQFWQTQELHLRPFINEEIDILRFIWFSIVRIANVWFWILTCVGYAAHYLNRPSNLLTHLNKVVYPVFCLHLPVLVALEFYILPTQWPIAIKFLLITSFAVVVLLCLYKLLSPLRFIHPLIGMKHSVPALKQGMRMQLG